MSGPTGGQVGGAARRQEVDGADAHRVEQAAELVLDDLGQGADDEQRERVGGCGGRIGTRAARQASSPWVKVVSMPLPE